MTAFARTFIDVLIAALLLLAAILLLACTGCAPSPYKQLQPAPVVQSVTPAAKELAAKVDDQKPLAAVETAIAALPPSVQRDTLTQTFAVVRQRWTELSTTVHLVLSEALAQDVAIRQVNQAIKDRDAVNSAQAKQIEANESKTQRTLFWIEIAITLMCAAGCVLVLWYMHNVKLSALIVFVGGATVVFLRLMGWIDLHWERIAWTVIISTAVYLIGETCIHYFHDKPRPSIWRAIVLAIIAPELPDGTPIEFDLSTSPPAEPPSPAASTVTPVV